jgi:excinuclease ABC subunit B
MQQAIDETHRRRIIQNSYNQEHNITPETIHKEVTQIFNFKKENEKPSRYEVAEDLSQFKSLDDVDAVIKSLDAEMRAAARDLEFERAAELRDQIKRLKKLIVIEI